MAIITRDAKADLAFGVLSDLHMTHRGEGLQKLNQYLKLYSDLTPAIDAHVFAGDIVYQIDVSGGGVCTEIYPEPYDYLKMAYERYAKDIPLIYTMGNHEYPQNNKSAELSEQARQMYLAKGHEFRTHAVVKGYHFIQISIHSWNNDFLPEDEEWAMTEIRRALRASGDKPVFVIYHPPLVNTVMHCEKEKHHSEKFQKFLLSSKRIFNICGHMHFTSEEPRTIWQRRGGGTIIHAPESAVGNVSIYGADRRYENGIFYSQSLFFEVTGTRIVIHKVDNLTGMERGEPWVVDVAGEQYYTDARLSKAARPAFPAGAKAEADFFRGKVWLRFPKAKCAPLTGNADEEVPYYRISFCKKGETEPCKVVTRDADFYTCYPSAVFDEALAVTLEPGVYTVKIAPISFFDKVGRPISARLRVPENPEKPNDRKLPEVGMV